MIQHIEMLVQGCYDNSHACDDQLLLNKGVRIKQRESCDKSGCAFRWPTFTFGSLQDRGRHFPDAGRYYDPYLSVPTGNNTVLASALNITTENTNVCLCCHNMV